MWSYSNHKLSKWILITKTQISVRNTYLLPIMVSMRCIDDMEPKRAHFPINNWTLQNIHNSSQIPAGKCQKVNNWAFWREDKFRTRQNFQNRFATLLRGHSRVLKKWHGQTWDRLVFAEKIRQCPQWSIGRDSNCVPKMCYVKVSEMESIRGDRRVFIRSFVIGFAIWIDSISIFSLSVMLTWSELARK